MQNKCLIFTGAGFPFLFKEEEFNSINIDGTESITDLIKKKEYRIKTKSGSFENLNLCDIIYKDLIITNNNVNFESIINVLESLSYYYSKFDFTDNKIFNVNDLYNEVLAKIGIFNNSILVNDELIPLGNSKNKERIVWRKVYIDTICSLIDSISYDYPLSENYGGKQNCGNSKKGNILTDFFNKIRERYIIRHYTTNYDNTFNYFFEGNYQNGFDIKNGITTTKSDERIIYPFNIKTLSDENDNLSCNIHGSIYWVAPKINMYNAERETFYRPQNSILTEEFSNEMLEANPMENMFWSPIITGYRKSQRILQEPFIHYFNAFYNDSFRVDKVIIIGYSFGDPYINRILGQACKRKNVSIDLVDNFGEDIKRENFDIIKKTKWFSESNIPNTTCIGDGIYNIKGNNIEIHFHSKGVAKYLQHYLNQL